MQMIHDLLSQSATYEKLHPLFPLAFAAEKKWESHRVFGDIQVMFSGEEICGHHPANALRSTESYQENKDVEKFAHPTTNTNSLLLKPGSFTIFYPSDGHQPGVMVNHPTEVLKVVIKFRLE
ncbi:DUF386 domain-containing protein [bacterium]|nr:DUF386 domain-containing protein [bacterium]